MTTQGLMVVKAEDSPSSPLPAPARTAGSAPGSAGANPGRVLALCNFLSKGWEVSILGLMAFVQQKYSLPLYTIGILGGIFIVSQITISLFAGKLAHAVGGKWVILLSIAASACSWLALGLSREIIGLSITYTIAGLSSGLFEPIGNSLIAKWSTPKTRGTAIGNFAACGDMGRIAVMTAATALAGFFGVAMAAALLLITPCVAFFAAMLLIPRDSRDAQEPEHRIPVARLFHNRRFRLATFAGIADSFSSASLYIFIPFLLAAKNISLGDTLYFDVIFFVGYMSGRLVMGRLADKYGGPDILMTCNTTMAGLVLLLTLVYSIPLIIVLLFLLGIFTRGSSPVIRAMVADSLDERSSFHDAFSAYSCASRSSGAVCRPVYGIMASAIGISSVFYLASAVALLTAVPAIKYKRAAPHS